MTQTKIFKISIQRNREFDERRADLYEMDQAQQQQIEELRGQIAHLAQGFNDQTNRNRVLETQFRLTADQIIKHFTDIPLFSGEDSYKLKSFLKNVEQAELLCGQDNDDLRTYCLAKVINGRIVGRARTVLLRIPDQERTWQKVIDTLKQHFRPRSTIHQLLFQARLIKVYNLKDLFNRLTKIEAEANEICDFNNEDNFTYKSIDRELVQIIIDHCIPTFQIHIDENLSLIELDNKMCRTELYHSDEIIKPYYKMNKSNILPHQSKPRNPTDVQNFVKPPQNNHNQQLNTSNTAQHFRNNVNQQSLRNSGQFRQNFPNNSGQNNSLRFRNSGQFRQNQVPMEIDNIYVDQSNPNNNSNQNHTNAYSDEGNYNYANTFYQPTNHFNMAYQNQTTNHAVAPNHTNNNSTEVNFHNLPQQTNYQ